MLRWDGCTAKKYNFNFIEKYKNFRDFVLLNGIQYRLPYHELPQSSMIVDDIDFVGKFENFQEDYMTACKKIGVRKHRLLHKNKSKHQHYTRYYDHETRQIIAEKFASDIDEYGYHFGE